MMRVFLALPFAAVAAVFHAIAHLAAGSREVYSGSIVHFQGVGYYVGPRLYTSIDEAAARLRFELISKTDEERESVEERVHA
jgi:hypothetical protein